MNKRFRITLSWLLVLILAIALVFFGVMRLPSARRAEKRVQAFAQAINYSYKEPAKIYSYLDASYRSAMSESAFSEAFTKERSYPYLTPLFLNFESLSMESDKRHGLATFSQAARLPGMYVEIPVVFEDGDYYCRFFEEFLDGSYLEKFERLAREGS